MTRSRFSPEPAEYISVPTFYEVVENFKKSLARDILEGLGLDSYHRWCNLLRRSKYVSGNETMVAQLQWVQNAVEGNAENLRIMFSDFQGPQYPLAQKIAIMIIGRAKTEVSFLSIKRGLVPGDWTRLIHNARRSKISLTGIECERALTHRQEWRSYA